MAGSTSSMNRMQKLTDKVLRSDSIRVKPKDERESLSSERLKNTVELPKSGYGLHTSGDIYSPSTPNLPPEGTRYDVKKDASVAPRGKK
jgi:hypothetical protein